MGPGHFWVARLGSILSRLIASRSDGIELAHEVELGTGNHVQLRFNQSIFSGLSPHFFGLSLQIQPLVLGLR